VESNEPQRPGLWLGHRSRQRIGQQRAPSRGGLQKVEVQVAGTTGHHARAVRRRHQGLKQLCLVLVKP